MSSGNTVIYLNYISKQLNMYLSSLFYICNLSSNVLCILMFISMKRLRKNPSSTYLLVSSICNLILFNTSFLSRIFLPNFIFDPSSQSLIWCKLRQYLGHWSSFISLFSIAWAMIDQYLSTSINVRLRQLSTVKKARYLVSLTCLVSFIHSLPLIIYNEIHISKNTNISSCSLSMNPIYQNYVAYFVTPFLLGIIPMLIMIVFGILSYANINYLHQQQMRTQIQQQLTQMIISQCFFVFIGIIALTTQTIYNLLTMSIPKSTFRQALENVFLTITGVFAYTGYTFNFYIYLFVSPSLRKHFKQLIKKHLCHVGNQNNHRIIVNNQITPMVIIES